MNFTGIIIAESLKDLTVLDDVTIVKTDIEPVTPKHKTPWITQWTMHDVEVPAHVAYGVALKISKALDTEHTWYADYKTEKEHFIIYSDKVFHITDRSDASQYDEATKYGISIGIPEYQVDFTPHIQKWER